MRLIVKQRGILKISNSIQKISNESGYSNMLKYRAPENRSKTEKKKYYGSTLHGKATWKQILGRRLLVWLANVFPLNIHYGPSSIGIHSEESYSCMPNMKCNIDSNNKIYWTELIHPTGRQIQHLVIQNNQNNFSIGPFFNCIPVAYLYLHSSNVRHLKSFTCSSNIDVNKITMNCWWTDELAMFSPNLVTPK